MWMNNIVQKMIDWIESHLSEGFSLEQLGKDMIEKIKKEYSE